MQQPHQQFQIRKELTKLKQQLITVITIIVNNNYINKKHKRNYDL